MLGLNDCGQFRGDFGAEAPGVHAGARTSYTSKDGEVNTTRDVEAMGLLRGGSGDPVGHVGTLRSRSTRSLMASSWC